MEGIAAIIVAVVAAAAAMDRFWQKRVQHKDTTLQEGLSEMKAELMSHVTANRIQSDRFTRKSVDALQHRQDETNETLLGLLADLEVKVTKQANSKRVRVTAPEKVGF